MILPLSQQVCTLESAKRLKELSFCQESLFYWEMIPGILNSKKFSPIITSHPNCDLDIYSAYTCSELGEMLNQHLNWTTLKVAENNKYRLFFRVIDLPSCRIDQFDSDTESEARAKMLIHLAESGLMKGNK